MPLGVDLLVLDGAPLESIFVRRRAGDPPESNADALRTLGRHGVLSVPLGDAMALAVGFRNVLVHGYVEVDDRRVVAFLNEVGDLQAFVDSVAAWTTNQA